MIDGLKEYWDDEDNRKKHSARLKEAWENNEDGKEKISEAIKKKWEDNDFRERVTNRVKHGGHDIPADLILRRYEHRFEQLDKILKYCDTAKFYDNTNGYVLVATYANDTITQEVEDAPKWLSDFYEEKIYYTSYEPGGPSME